MCLWAHFPLFGYSNVYGDTGMPEEFNLDHLGAVPFLKSNSMSIQKQAFDISRSLPQ